MEQTFEDWFDGTMHRLYSDITSGRILAPGPLLALVCAALFIYFSGEVAGKVLFGIYDRLCGRCMDRVALAPYHSADFWEEEHAESSETFEWYAEVWELTQILGDVGVDGKKVLYVGCGTSELGAAIHDNGALKVVNMDICEDLIEQRRQAEAGERPDQMFVQGDALNMSFEDGFFDIVIDKGLMDSLECAPDGGQQLVSRFLSEVCRVLAPGGQFVLVTASEVSDLLLASLCMELARTWDLHSKPKEGPLCDRSIHAVLIRKTD